MVFNFRKLRKFLPNKVVMCPSHFCGVRLTSPSSQSHLNFFQVQSESSHKNCRVTSSHWFASSSQCPVKWNSTFPCDVFYDKLVLNELKMAPYEQYIRAQRAKNGAKCCFSNFISKLFRSEFLWKQFPFHFSSPLCHFHKPSPNLAARNIAYLFFTCPKHEQRWTWTWI